MGNTSIIRGNKGTTRTPECNKNKQTSTYIEMKYFITTIWQKTSKIQKHQSIILNLQRSTEKVLYKSSLQKSWFLNIVSFFYFSDLLQNPLIVPVKVLHGHKITKDLGVIDCEFHPTQPWVFSSGADGTIRLFT